MIVIDDGRNYTAYYRKNKRVQWRYAEYAGRWHTLEEAIEEVKYRLDGERGQYHIENGVDEWNGDIN